MHVKITLQGLIKLITVIKFQLQKQELYEVLNQKVQAHTLIESDDNFDIWKMGVEQPTSYSSVRNISEKV